MPVEKVDELDLVTLNPKTNEIALLMVEDRDWRQVPEALPQLNTKLMLYADYIVSGSLAREYQEAAKCSIAIRLEHFCPITESVIRILRDWADKLSGVPVSICSYRHYWNPLVRFFRGLAIRFSDPNRSFVRWAPDQGANPRLLSRAQFAEEFIAAWRQKNPALQIQIVRDLQLKIIDAQGKDSTGFLDNAYNQVMVAPENKQQIFAKYAAGFVESANKRDEPIDRGRIVPILKARQWLQEVNNNAKVSGCNENFEAVHELYNAELMIVYAHDTPKTVSYLTPDNLANLKLEPKDLFKLACKNLETMLPLPDIQPEGQIYRIRAGGDYDACLLLLDNFWNIANIDVNGEIIAAIPARDFLVVTGSANFDGVRQIKLIAETVASQAAYRLTSKLFVRRQGKFVVCRA